MVICGGNVIFRNLCVIKYNMLKFNNCLAYFKFVWSQLNNTFFFRSDRGHGGSWRLEPAAEILVDFIHVYKIVTCVYVYITCVCVWTDGEGVCMNCLNFFFFLRLLK